MKTREELQAYFECTAEQVEALLEIQETGKRHGEAGWYPDGDFSSDADWCYGVGARINDLEEAFGDECGDVFDVYHDAFNEHFSLQAESCVYKLEARHCRTPVRGNAAAYDDREKDKAVEDEIIERVNNGEVWAWCDVIVTCSFRDDSAQASVGAVSVADEAEFRRHTYYLDLCAEAFQALKAERGDS